MKRNSLLIVGALASALTGCGGIKGSLRYEPSGPAATLNPSFPVAVSADAGDAVLSTDLPEKLKLEEPAQASLQRALELELSHLGWRVVNDDAAAARVRARLLEVSCHFYPGNADVLFSLSVEGRDGKELGRRLVRGSFRTAAFNRWGCPPVTEGALADAMRQLGLILDGEGWADSLAGRPSAASGAAFPASTGGVLVLPVEDPFGQINQVEFLGKRHQFVSTAAPPFRDAALAALQQAGWRIVDRRSSADFIVRSAVAHALNELEGSIGGRVVARLRYAVQVEDRAGAVLWRGWLDGQDAARFGFELGKAAGEVTLSAARQAGSGLAAALQGRPPAELFTSADLEAARRRAEKGGPLFGKHALELASSIAGNLGAFGDLARFPGGSSLRAAQKGLDAVAALQDGELSRLLPMAGRDALLPAAQPHWRRAQGLLAAAKAPADFSRASAELAQVLRLDPGWTSLYLNLGLAQEKSRDYAAAIESFNRFAGSAVEPERGAALKKIERLRTLLEKR